MEIDKKIAHLQKQGNAFGALLYEIFARNASVNWSEYLMVPTDVIDDWIEGQSSIPSPSELSIIYSYVKNHLDPYELQTKFEDMLEKPIEDITPIPKAFGVGGRSTTSNLHANLAGYLFLHKMDILLSQLVTLPVDVASLVLAASVANIEAIVYGLSKEEITIADLQATKGSPVVLVELLKDKVSPIEIVPYSEGYDCY